MAIAHMNFTPSLAKYFAYELTKRSSSVIPLHRLLSDDGSIWISIDDDGRLT
ncbi:MAG: hypothetical protein Q7T53_08415 [Deltaproteobacteria bacterium]|nr:hypothetical protein [Deltaproteobacteria bacterium]